jgi:hypothetical protein
LSAVQCGIDFRWPARVHLIQAFRDGIGWLPVEDSDIAVV